MEIGADRLGGCFRALANSAASTQPRPRENKHRVIRRRPHVGEFLRNSQFEGRRRSATYCLKRGKKKDPPYATLKMGKRCGRSRQFWNRLSDIGVRYHARPRRD